MKDSFDVIVGQGWNIDALGCVNRKSCTKKGNDIVAGNPVAQYLADNGWPFPKDDTLQFVLPACDAATSCRYAKLNKDNVANSFDGETVNIPLPDPNDGGANFLSPCGDEVL